MKERYVKEVDVSLVKFNNENPRQIFDQEAEDKLYFSIKRKGVLVPILVCSDNGKFLLIDGERRVRASIRTGLNKIPANIIEKDSPLEYATKMFHIHNLGVGWRLMATAQELQKLKELSKTSKE
ncbi:MAG: ParB/RepB/Spo0J family partition protein, partial [Nanoarchaeota archaeon]